MKIPAFIVNFAIRQFASTAAASLSQCVVTLSMQSLNELTKLSPGVTAQVYDAQEAATRSWGVLALLAGVLCDDLKLSEATKAQVLAEMAAHPPVIPIKPGIPIT